MKRATLRRAILAAFGASLLIAGIPARAAGQQPAGAGMQAPPDAAKVAAPAPAPKTTLADFAWLAGRWQGAWGPRIAQQVWTAPRAGVMLGTFQLAENDKTLVLELFTLVEDTDGIQLHLRHFTPSLVAWEKASPAVLKLASTDPKTITFENPVDGQPKRASFTRIDADTYVLRSEIVPEKGDLQVTEITYRRQVDAPPSKRHRKSTE
ncbi:MAG TPA: DUF6265 family protein [Candidatus Acidoferrales bacterium]|nr:DUF6265 family protein [Candidatus Acidoferrales bacterium]